MACGFGEVETQRVQVLCEKALQLVWEEYDVICGRLLNFPLAEGGKAETFQVSLLLS